MNQRIIYILNILLVVVFFLRPNAVSAFDGEAYVEETATQLSKIIEANQLLINEGKASEGAYLFNKFKDTYNVDLINTQDAQDIEETLGTLNGEVAVVVHTPYAVGDGGIKKALSDVNRYSLSIFSKVKAEGKELVLVNVWTIFHRDGKFASYQVSVLQTANIKPETRTYAANLSAFLTINVHSLKKITQALKGNTTVSTSQIYFMEDELISAQLTSTSQTNLSDIYLTQSCEYIQFTVAITNPVFEGNYLKSFTYEGKVYNYSYNILKKEEDGAEVITGKTRPSTTEFLPLRAMRDDGTGFTKVVCKNGNYITDIAGYWFFNQFTVKSCAQVTSFKTNGGVINLTSTTCQAFLNDCNNGTNTANTGTGNSSVINYSQDANGVSMITDAEYNSILGQVNGLNTVFGVSVKTYILTNNNPNYNNLRNEAIADPSSNKFIIKIDVDETGKHTIHLEHKFEIPDWLRPSTSLANDDGCISDYINESLDKLHENELYKASILSDQIIAEYSVAIYRGIFGSLYCATNENSVLGKSWAIKFLAGATHELIATVDVADMVSGLVEVAKGVTKAIVSSHTSYLVDIKQTYEDISAGTEIPINLLLVRLMPPNVRLMNGAYNTVSTVGSNFVKFYFTECGSTDICPYRYGQITVMIIPIVFTAGQWAWVKGPQLTSKIKTLVTLNRTDDVINILADAEKIPGTTINEVSDVITIKDGENITTIEKSNNSVVVKKNGVEVLEEVGDYLEYLRNKGYSAFEEFDDFIILRDGGNRTGKILDKSKLDDITWFTPKTGNTWPIHEANVTDYLKFKYGNKVATQVKIKTYHKNGTSVEGYLDDLVETEAGDLIIVDAKHSQKAQIVDGKIPGYTEGQKQSYQWITDGDAVKIEIIGDGASSIPGLGRNVDILPRLKGKVGVITNDANGQMVELSVYKTTR